MCSFDAQKETWKSDKMSKNFHIIETSKNLFINAIRF